MELSGHSQESLLNLILKLFVVIFHLDRVDQIPELFVGLQFFYAWLDGKEGLTDPIVSFDEQDA